MKLLDDADEFVDGEGEFVELTGGVVANSDALDLLVDLSQGETNVWGDTPGIL